MNLRHYVVAIALIALFANPVLGQESGHNSMPFSEWLQSFKQEARAQGISEKVLNDAFEGVEPIDTVIELDRKQPEGVITYAKYIANALPQKRIDKGRDLLNENRSLLKSVQSKYGVPASVIVALWGIESDFGDHTGNFNVVESLATLAYDGRRSSFFRKELLQALTIIEHADITAEDMSGSWAGAMGQCQFMPSTYINHAVDHDGDGKRDIWFTLPDVFASIANYLSSLGWDPSEGLGVAVELPEHFNRQLANINQSKSLKEWRKLGVKIPDSPKIADEENNVFLINVGKNQEEKFFIITANYKRLLIWNRSRYFASAVTLLADQLEE
ncbi:MAG: lytic murein transglycosylase [Rickettsiales bacterium]|nr:lytic murein transglycosylase [Rickettsiales bacterium]